MLEEKQDQTGVGGFIQGQPSRSWGQKQRTQENQNNGDAPSVGAASRGPSQQQQRTECTLREDS